MFSSAHILIITASLLLLSNSATALALEQPAGSANAKTLQTRGDTDPISVNDACKFQHGKDFSAYAVGSGCNDWVCQSATEQRGVDFKNWCFALTDRETDCNIEARCGNGIYSWVCWYGSEWC